ncbi:Kinesin-like protein [Mycena indigotica]|uniref:Kinesin-like protein n=1 Tax=Mycena indigotica TaxID=2126181 RepID=A0A8H6WGN3_9AGAR|nr:Kinesin-like protein [Mycena indigotica]KAF7316051.1 Kinesin-like protein [Mycena indigotica]
MERIGSSSIQTANSVGGQPDEENIDYMLTAKFMTALERRRTTELQGVARALALPNAAPKRTAAAMFDLTGRVAVITGAQRGIGLELALGMAEMGAVVYCLDLPESPDDDWRTVQAFAAALETGGRLEYRSADVTDQKGMWSHVEEIVKKEGRIDACVANAGVLHGAECLEYPGDEFKKLMDVNVNGVLFTAQAAGREMERLGIPGSIILIASMSGTITNPNQHWVAYNTSKAAVTQMARSMACELAPKGIRVNSVSPGYIFTDMTRSFLDKNPGLKEKLSAQNPMNRFGRPTELRGVALWLASDASTFCTGSDIKVDGVLTKLDIDILCVLVARGHATAPWRDCHTFNNHQAGPKPPVVRGRWNAWMATSGKAVKVIARLRPRLPGESADDGIRVCHGESGTNTSSDTSSNTSGSSSMTSFTGIAVNNPRDTSQIFRFPFTSAYDADATQEDIFSSDVRPLVDVALSGVTVTIFAYGVTSSGKTYTMQGNSSEPGVIPRVVQTLFDKSTTTEVAVSYIEIYKDDVYDLLVTRESAPKLPVRENEAGVVFVAGLTSMPITSVEEFDTIYSTATRQRSVGATRLNDQSSRSHAVLTLNLKTREGNMLREGKINLVDLAGSENNKQTGNDQARMAESKAINTSLSTLGMVVHALNTGQSRIPYRNSKLTRLLQDALGGSSVGLLICNLAPTAKFRQDTLNTLNFAVRTKNIENKPVVNERDIRPPHIDLAQMQPQANPQAALGHGRPVGRQSLVPRPVSRTSTFGVGENRRQSALGLGAVNRANLPAPLDAVAEKEKDKGLSEAEIDARIAKAVEAEVARRLAEREREQEKERAKARQEWEEEREREREEERRKQPSSRAQSRSPKKEKRSPKKEKASAPSSSNSKRSREDNDSLAARLAELEGKLHADTEDASRVDSLSPVSRKKIGRSFVELARTHQNKGELNKAVDLYRRALLYVPGNTKLEDRILDIEAAIKKGKAFKGRKQSSPKKAGHRKIASGEMDVDEGESDDQMEVDEVESSLTGADAFGAEVTNMRVTRSKSKTKRGLDGGMEATPAKRAKRTLGDESDEENDSSQAPRKRGKGRTYRQTAAAS